MITPCSPVLSLTQGDKTEKGEETRPAPKDLALQGPQETKDSWVLWESAGPVPGIRGA